MLHRSLVPNSFNIADHTRGNSAGSVEFVRSRKHVSANADPGQAELTDDDEEDDQPEAKEDEEEEEEERRW